MSDDDSAVTTTAALPEITGYRVLRVLGRGGMSTVYLGEQTSLGREVAIKVMVPEALADEVSRRRFENEARTIARLEHPHIVGIFDVGRTADGLPYYSMPHLPRGHLGQRLVDAQGATMDPERVREILRGLLSALGYAHARGTIHRDVKAENVLFDEAGRPLLADFGIALRRGHGTRVTTAGLAVGSTAYMPPEQARGEDVDPRADLYSVGVLAWEMLTGKLPYESTDALSMAVMHIKDPIPKLPPRLRHWQAFVERALAKTPGKRYRDAAQMLEALQAVRQRGNTQQFRALSRLRAARLPRIPKVAWLGVVLVAAAGIGIALNRGNGSGDTFYRAGTGTAGRASGAAPGSSDAGRPLPIPGATPGQSVVGNPDGTDLGNGMLRAAPDSAAERWVAQADAQIRARRLTSPASGNAVASVLTAYREDKGYGELPAAVGRVVDALSADAARRLADGDDDAARDSVLAARKLAAGTAQARLPALQKMDAALTKALAARIEAAGKRYDRDAAQRVLDSAQAMAVSAAGVRTLTAKVERIPLPGARIPDLPGDLRLVRDGARAFAIASQPVSRDEYGRFATATNRPDTLCRERASLLRIVAPRTWKSPGFEQSGNQPVVCVSGADAEAYARWAGDRDGHRYRLPRASETSLMPAAGGRRIAEWSGDCSGGCSKRVASGGSKGGKAIDAARGYDDVGIRLVSDL